MQMKVTLSYFPEPGPGEIGWKDRYRYASFALRFDVKSPSEEREEFLRRINVAARSEDEGHPGTQSASDHWVIGSNGRDKGSIHSDIWRGNAAELAASDYDLQWGLRAVVEIEVPPADSTQVPDLPPKLYSYIDELGEITDQRLWVVPEETEERRLIEQETQAGQILADVYNQLQNHLNDIMLLNTVVPIDGMRNRPDLNSYIGPTGSMKSLLNLIFVPRGYRYQRTFSKGERFEGVIKRTKNNNYIVLDFSGIAFLNRFGFNFIVKGMFWEHTLPVTVPRDQVLRQHTRDFFDRQRYVHYAARIADNLETILVQRIESIYGPSPPWNSYDG